MIKANVASSSCAVLLVSTVLLAGAVAACRDSGPTINPSKMDQRPNAKVPVRRSAVRTKARRAAARIPWRRGRRSLIAEMHVDEKSDTVLVRMLSFKGPCLPIGVYSEVPAACTPKKTDRQEPPQPMTVALRRFKLSDGSEVSGRIGPAPRMLKSDQPADEAVVDYRGTSLVRVINGRRTIEYYQGKRISRWSAPKGQRIEDAKILSDGARVVVATGSYGRRNRPKGRITVWDPKRNQVVMRTGIRVKPKLFRKMITATMSAQYYHVSCISGYAEMCKKGKKVMVYGRGLRRPNRIRLALSDMGRLMASYAYGDLFVYDMKKTKLVQRHHIADAFYKGRDWYILSGGVDVSGDGRKIAIFGKSGLVRIVSSSNGAMKDRVDRKNTAHADISGLSSAATFDLKGKGGRALWLGYGSLLRRTFRTGWQDTYRLSDGLLVEVDTAQSDVPGEAWEIEKIVATKKRLVVMARGRVMVFDKKRMRSVGMLGVASSASVRRSIVWGSGVKWFRSWRGM